VTRASLREYAAVQRLRYQQATRVEKHQLLDEIVAVTGLHRKSAIRLLGRAPRARPSPGPGGRPRTYGPEVAAAAEVLWQASGRIGAHRLQPFMPELLDRLILWGELTVAPDVEKLLRRISRPTLARVLAPARAQFPLRGATITRPSHLLRQEIPVRTFADWDDACPGFLEIDLVAHCGSTTDGFYLCTLCAVDITTAWIELEAVWGKNQERVGSAAHRVRERLPVPSSASTAITAASSSIGNSWRGASATASPLPAAARGRRTTALTWSRRRVTQGGSTRAFAIASSPVIHGVPPPCSSTTRTTSGATSERAPMTCGKLSRGPILRLDPYATSGNEIFVCSSSSPPGGGVHGMCGYWAALSVLNHHFDKQRGPHDVADPCERPNGDWDYREGSARTQDIALKLALAGSS